MADYSPTPAQVKALVEASHDLAAYIAADACRVVSEWPDEANLVPYLETIPVKAARDFYRAIFSITNGEMESASAECDQRAKYEAAMAEAKAARLQSQGANHDQ